MKKVTTVIMALSLVLGSVALVAAGEVSQPSEDLQLSALEKITDQEAQEIRGTGLGFGVPQFQYRIDCSMPCQTDTLTSALTTHILMQSSGGKGDLARDQLRNGSCQLP